MKMIQTWPLTAMALMGSLLLTACDQPAPPPEMDDHGIHQYYGTLEPFVGEAVYFVVTDRFVNGDPANDYPQLGGELSSFDRPLPPCDGVSANVGYLGGDFRGLADHADYIREMGFSAVWITPIVDNPDQIFTGGSEISCNSILSDRGKAAYHGYWGVNFYQLDEHLPSADFAFTDLTRTLRQNGLKTVLDIVGNHGSPAWSMVAPQPEFGQIYASDGQLLADHGNLPPDQLQPQSNPLHRFFNTEPGLAQLGDLDEDNPAVLDYLSGAYLQWIDQGAAAFRIDTIPYMPHRFWKAFSDRIREQHPDFFMFAEAFNDDASVIAEHTLPANGGISVLDFPLRKQLRAVFEQDDGDFSQLERALYLEDGPYANPYELATFYDNHDMARMQADDAGFINAHNWLFTARGFPVIYYGSEMGFMRGRAEHAGNRNYFGVEGIAAARQHPIRQALSRIAKVRAQSPALQRGLQVNLLLDDDLAAFYRVFQHQGEAQTALVLLNKGAASAELRINKLLQPGSWQSAFDEQQLSVADGEDLVRQLPANGIEVWMYDAPLDHSPLLQRLDRAMARKSALRDVE
ncbi:MAG: alpha-amylase family glycosyl hydrolase [Wenzhouxiangellaceae bacterium]